MARGAAVLPTPPDTRLSDADSIMWRIAADPVLRSPILVVGLLDRAPDAGAVAAAFDRAAPLLPGLRCRIAPPPAGSNRPRWEPVPGFSADHHIRRVGATGGGLRSVLDLAAADATAPFDPERPPWSVTIVEGLAAERAAFVLRFHHAVTDGMGGLHTAAYVFDACRHPSEAGRPAATGGQAERNGNGSDPDGNSGNGSGEELRDSPGPRPAGARLGSAVRGTVTGALSAARDPLGTATTALRVARSLGRMVAAAPGGSELFAGRGLDRHLHVFEVALPELRSAARASGGTINDTLLAAVAGAFRSYHDHHGVEVPTMSVTMPIDRRRPGEGVAGNRFVPARFTLPIDEPDPATRVRVAAAISRSCQDEPALDLAGTMAGALNRLPGPVVTRVFGAMLRTIDADIVDLAGLIRPAYIGGAHIDRMWAFSPPTGAAFSVTLLSHAEAACVAVTCDRAAVPEPDVLAGCVEAAFDEVLALATRSASPGDSRWEVDR